jgi:hypothetical protein
MARQRRADNRVRRRDIVSEAVAGLDLNLAAVLFEIGNPVSLEQNLDVGVLAGMARRLGVRDPVLACFDLTQLQLRNGGVVDPRLERRRRERIDGEPAAEIGQCL